MTSLGISAVESSSGNQVRVGFRSGLLRSLAVKWGGVGLVGVGLALITLAQKQPSQVFDLLKGWGWVWILVLAAMVLFWDLAKIALGYLGNLTQSVQDTAIAMNRIADKDDRERDRMVTETAIVGRRLERLSESQEQWMADQRRNHERLESMLQQVLEKKQD